jgi:phosphotransferase system HPr (HPr) family protein
MNQGPHASGKGPPNGQVASRAAGTGPIRRSIVIVNPRGLHLRIADRFARAAKNFAAAVKVMNGDSLADGKSPTDLIMLLAFQGTELVLEVDGPDAATAVTPLAEILADPGGEDFPSDDGSGSQNKDSGSGI